MYSFLIINAEKFITISVGVVINAMIARGIGVENFGIFQNALAIVAVFTALTYFCGNEILIPRLVNAKNEDEENRILNSALIIRLFLGILSYAALLFYFFYIDGDIVILVLGFPLIFKEALGISVSWFQAKSKNIYYSIILLGSCFFKLLLIISLYLYDGTKYINYALAFSIEALMSSVIIFIFFKKKNGAFSTFKYNSNIRYDIKEIFKKSIPISLGVLIMILFKKSDRIFLKDSVDQIVFGHYALASQLYENFCIFGTVILTVMSAKIVYKEVDYNKTLEKIVLIIKYQLALWCLILIFSISFLDFFVTLIFGSGYSSSVYYFKYFLMVLMLFYIDESISLLYFKYNLKWLYLLKWIFVMSLMIMFVFLKNFFLEEFGIISMIFTYAILYFISIFAGIFIFYVKNNNLRSYY